MAITEMEWEEMCIEGDPDCFELPATMNMEIRVGVKYEIELECNDSDE